MAEEMDCQDLVEMVTDYFEDALAETERTRLDAHLLECDGCVEYIAQIRTTVDLTGQVDVTVLAPPARETLLGVFRTWHAGLA